MTRRVVYFYNESSGRYYISPEFNGDRDELKQFHSSDTCDQNWENILALFTDIKDPFHFMQTVAAAMGCYHPSIPSPLPGIRIRNTLSYDQVPEADEVYMVSPDGSVSLDSKKSILCME